MSHAIRPLEPLVCSKPTIFVLTDYYLPGYRGGGPVQSISNVVEALGDEFDFRIVTADRDLGSRSPYPDVRAHCWTRVGKAVVMYLPRGYRSGAALFRLLREERPRVLYLNSLMSRQYSLYPLLLRLLSLIDVGRVILAPRGELSAGALRIKAARKRLLLSVARHTRLYRDVLWQASSEHEKGEICFNFFDANVAVATPVPVFVARDLGKTAVEVEVTSDKRTKPSGELRIAFLSRICRMKNLHGALEMLRPLKGQVRFTIYGPIEDSAYWNKCQAAISALPSNVTVQYAGEIAHDLVSVALRNQDVFLLPTLGENFGHVIIEALQTGCPVILSDRTPWRYLESAGVGWDIPLRDSGRFEQALQTCIDMSSDDFCRLSRRALEFGIKATSGTEALEENRRLLLAANGVRS